jgi:hypothetical protein
MHPFHIVSAVGLGVLFVVAVLKPWFWPFF